jgi:hypothetical protein
VAEFETILDHIGLELAEAFFPASIASRLAGDVAEAERLGCPLELALQVEDALAGLPWEALRLPNRPLPLTLHPRVHLYRRLPSAGATTAIAIPPPLRILVAIGSPEAQNARGQLLDMEAELRRILDATDKAKGKAYVRILETGSPEAICEALRQQRYHVLYISCHAEPGRLVLETADEVRLTGSELIDRAIPAGRGAPLVVLAACSTASDRPGDPDAKAEELPAIARALVAHGVPHAGAGRRRLRNRAGGRAVRGARQLAAARGTHGAGCGTAGPGAATSAAACTPARAPGVGDPRPLHLRRSVATVRS